MSASIFQGLFQILFRVWTFGVFYFLNNRLFSWLKDSRTPRIKYHKIPRSRQEKRIFTTKEQELCLLTSTNYSWKNLIFMNLANSRKQRDSCTQIMMFSPFEKRLFHSQSKCSKDVIIGSNLHLSLNIQGDTFRGMHDFLPCDIQRGKQLGDIGDCSDSNSPIYCRNYSTDLAPCQCLTKSLEFLDPVSYENYLCDRVLQMENKKIDLDNLGCLCPKMYSTFMKPDIYEEYMSDSATLEGCKNLNMDHFDKKCPHYSTELNIIKPVIVQDYFNCAKIQKENMKQKLEDLPKEGCVFPKEGHCNSAASIDSGFQSFHSINTTYTCFDIGDVTLYISNICYNHDGKVMGMTVGFGAEEDSSLDSIFSDEDEDSDDDDECYSEDEDICSDSEEDFIVFDNEQCDSTAKLCPNSIDEFTVAVNLDSGCSSFEVKISQTCSPSPYFCHVKVDECHKKLKPKKDSRLTFETDVNVTKDKEEHDQNKGKSFKAKNVEGNNTNVTKDKYFPEVDNNKEENAKVQRDESDNELHNSRESKLQFKNENSIKIEEDKVENNGQSNSSAGAAFSPRKQVQFKNDVDIHTIVTWEYAYRQARLGPWKDLATNRAHFKRRIQEIAEVVEPILIKKINMIAS